MKRISGHYWVMLNVKRHEPLARTEVAYYDQITKTWHMIGTNKVFYEKDFGIIHEEIIKR